jgi:hypothetical protein
MKVVSLWYSDVELNCDHLFADYYEPEGVYQVRLGGNIPGGTLLESSESKVRSLGVKLDAPQLLMEMEELKWSMDEFLEKGVLRSDIGADQDEERDGVRWRRRSAVAEAV